MLKHGITLYQLLESSFDIMEQHNSEITFAISPVLNFNNNDVRDDYQHFEEYTSVFPCSICRKCFTTEQRLMIHMHFHTSDNSFSCKICHQRFSEMTELLAHVKNHRNEIPIKRRTHLRRGTKRLRNSRKYV